METVSSIFSCCVMDVKKTGEMCTVFLSLLELRRNCSLSLNWVSARKTETPKSPHWLLLWPGWDLNQGGKLRRGEKAERSSTEFCSPRGPVSGWQQCWKWCPAASEVRAPVSEDFTCDGEEGSQVEMSSWAWKSRQCNQCPITSNGRENLIRKYFPGPKYHVLSQQYTRYTDGTECNHLTWPHSVCVVGNFCLA